MKEIRIEKLCLENFKCHDHLTLDFAARNASIYGDNASGKTSIYDALTWLLFGKDSLGSGAVEVKPLNTEGEVRDHLAVTQVIALLRVDGRQWELRRAYREVWAVKRGEKTPAFQGNTSEYYVDGVPCRKNEYLARVRTLVEEDTFRMLTTISRFAGELGWQQRREILYDLAQVAGDRELLKSQPQFAPVLKELGDLSLADYQKKLLAEKKSLSTVKSDIPARISEVENTLRELGSPDFDALRARRTLLQQRLETMTTDTRERIRSRELDLRQLEQDNTAYRGSQGQQEIQRRLRENAEKMAQSRVDLEGALQQVQADLEAEQARQFEGGLCPTCGQSLPGAALERARYSFLREQTRRVDALKLRLSDLMTRRAEGQARLARLEQEQEALQAQLKALRQADAAPEDLPGYAQHRQQLLQELESLQRELAAQSGQDAQRRETEKELRQLDQQLGRESLLKTTRERQEKLLRDSRELHERLEKIGEQLYLLEAFSRFKVQLAEAGINSRFRLARFRLCRELLGGGVEDCCDVMLDGVPYGNLNTGARINLGIDIINTLSRHYGIRVPLFVDNAESITRLEPGLGQVIRLVVSPGESVLRLERE